MATQLPSNPVVKVHFFTVYWSISEYDQDKSHIIAFIFYGTKKKKNKKKNKDHTTSKVHMVLVDKNSLPAWKPTKIVPFEI